MAGAAENAPDNNETQTLTKARHKIRDTYRQRLGKKGKQMREALEKRIQRLGQEQLNMEYMERRKWRSDETFWDGNLPIYDKAGAAVPALRDMQVNIIRPAGDFLKGALKQDTPEGIIEVAGQGAWNAADGNEELMDICNEFDARLVAAMAQSEFTLSRERAIDSAVVTGSGYVHVGVKPAHDGKMLRFFSKHYDYRNVLCDHGCVDMDDAEFVFLLKEMDVRRLKKYYPDCEKERNDNLKLQTLERDYVQTTGATWQYESTRSIRGDRFVGNRSTAVRKRVVYGVGYLRDTITVNGIARDIILKVMFATDSSFDHVMLLKDPAWLGFEKPPVCRLIYERNKKSNMPYSPLVRDRKPIARQVTALARNFTPLALSRGVTVLTQGSMQAQETLMNKYIKMLSKPIVALPMSQPGAVNVLDFKNDVAKLLEGIKLMTTLASASGANIHPALLGEKTGVEAASAFQGMRDDALSSISTFQRELDRNVTEYASNIFLSQIEQYNGRIAPIARMANNRLITMGTDGDYRIENNSAIFRVRSVRRDMAFSEGHVKVLTALMNKLQETDADIALALYLNTLKVSSMPDRMVAVNNMKRIIMQSPNARYPDGLFSKEEERQMAQQQKQRNDEMERKNQLAEADLEADIDKKKAEAERARAEANRPTETDKTRDQADTIKDQAGIIADLERRLRAAGLL